MFLEVDRHLFEHTSFVLFFVAQLKAIIPIYKSLSPFFSVLEAGYMGQLLVNREADFNLKLSPVIGVDFDQIAPLFHVDEGHRFIHCIFGGTSIDNNCKGQQDEQKDSLIEVLRKAGKDLHEHCANFTDSKTFAPFLNIKNESLELPTKEDKEGLEPEAYLRPFSEGTACIKLEKQAIEYSYYQLSSSKREYLNKPVLFDQFSQFLSLLRPKKFDGHSRFLYPSITGTYGMKIYLYITENGVDGVSEGVYEYDPADHRIILVKSTLSEDLKTCYTPFNRKHVQQSKFCLFLIASLKDLQRAYKEKSMYLALLEAGYMGQLLMDKQAEFEMGVCPIGGLRFDKIRADFQLQPDEELLHSFVCGSHKLTIPKGWKFLESGRSAVKAPAPLDRAGQQDLAIVGISARFPGAENVDQFWQILKEGKNSFRDLSFGQAGHYRRNGQEKGNAHGFKHRGAFLDDVDCFDSLLFKISPAEAKSMDPQERLLLEVVWECLEHGGYTGDELNRVSGKVGVFIGAMWDDYQHYASEGWKDGRHMPTTSHHSSIANRISHVFDFSGPSLSVNTSCSSAMTAIHYAYNSIKNGECRAAMVGGVNIMSHPYHYGALTGLDLLSKQGESRPFGMQADGWVAGEGVGAVIIKSKEDAERDRDTIHGIIKGTAIGHCGKSVRYGAPDSSKQKESILRAIENAGLSAKTIHYVETAAAGAGMADASEMTALKEVFQHSGDEKSIVYVGSVKSNIGHLESASAMSQIIKVLLQMKHQQMCPTVGCSPVNPMIQLEGSRLEIIDELKPWDNTRPRRALINAFGATGSAGHLIVEEYLDQEINEKEEQCLILLSAATEEQLKQLAKRLADFLAKNTPRLPKLSDMAYTLRVGRVEMTERLAMVVESYEELQGMLNAYINGVEESANLFFKGSAAIGDMLDAELNPLDLWHIAEKWVQGIHVPWGVLPVGNDKRVPLPTYPFAKEKHWISTVSSVSESSITEPSFKGIGELKGMERHLKEIFSEVSEIPVTRINPKAAFGEYGINSFMINRLNITLKKILENSQRPYFLNIKRFMNWPTIFYTII